MPVCQFYEALRTAALKVKGGGKQITTGFEADKVHIAQRNLAEGGMDALVEIR